MSVNYLSDETRKVRKSLLIVSLIGYAIYTAGISIKKVTILGVELSVDNFEAIPFLLGIMNLYLLITFIAFAWSEYHDWRYQSWREGLKELESGTRRSTREIQESVERMENEIEEFTEELKQLTIVPQLGSESDGDRQAFLSKEITEREVEIKRLTEILDKREVVQRFLNRKRIRSGSFRRVLELYVPIIVAVPVTIILLFFADVTMVTKTTGQRDINERIDQMKTSDSATVLEVNPVNE